MCGCSRKQLSWQSQTEVFPCRPKQRQVSQLLVFLLVSRLTQSSGCWEFWERAYAAQMNLSNRSLCQNEQPLSLLPFIRCPLLALQAFHLLRFILSVRQVRSFIWQNPGWVVCWFAGVAFHFFSKQNQFMEGFRIYYCNYKRGHSWWETTLTSTGSLKGHWLLAAVLS